MKKKIAISQSNYIPWKGYFDMINMVDVFVIYDEVQFTRRDWRNRNLLKTNNGLQWISIPVKQKEFTQTIDETEIVSNEWRNKHWKTLQHVYAKAPYFKLYRERFEDLYLREESLSLSEVNKRFILAICDILQIKTEIVNSRDLNLDGDKNERLIQGCKKLDGSIYVSGPAAKGYMDKEAFKNNNIEIEWADYSGYKEYRQMHPPFEHGVSILDLLFNEGDESREFLKSFKV